MARRRRQVPVHKPTGTSSGVSATSPVVVVGSGVVTLSDYLKQLRLQIILEHDAAPLEKGSVLPMRLVEMIIEQELIRQEAGRRGWTVSDEVVHAEIRRHFGESDEWETMFASLAEMTGMAKTEYRQVAADQLLADRLASTLAADVPVIAEQIHVRILWVKRQESADDIARRLAGGADFGYLAQRFSEHPSKDQRGDLGWVPRGIQAPEFDSVAFAIAAGDRAGPWLVGNGYCFAVVSDRDPARPLTPDQIEAARERAMPYYLEQLRRETPITYYWNSEQYAWAIERVQDLLYLEPAR